MMSVLYRYLSRYSPQTVERGLHALGLLTVLGILLIIKTQIFQPLLDEETQYTGQIQQAQQLINNRDEIAEQHKKSQEEFEEEGIRLETLKQKVPDSADKGGFLTQVAQLAQQSGIDVGGFTPGNVNSTPDYEELTINLAAHGTYESLCRFLVELDHLPRLCHVVNLKVHSTSDENERYPFELSLRIFFIPQT